MRFHPHPLPRGAEVTTKRRDSHDVETERRAGFGVLGAVKDLNGEGQEEEPGHDNQPSQRARVARDEPTGEPGASCAEEEQAERGGELGVQDIARSLAPRHRTS